MIARYLALATSTSLAVAVPAHAAPDPELAAGEEIETSVAGDLNAEGQPDRAAVIRGADARRLVVILSDVNEVDMGVDLEERLELDTAPLGNAELKFRRGVLTVSDLTGGTTATRATYRFRYDKAGSPDAWMRLIGMDAMLYSRTFAHDGFELSWNLLTGKLVTHQLHLNKKGGDAAYEPVITKTSQRTSPKVWLANTPDPFTLIEKVSKR